MSSKCWDLKHMTSSVTIISGTEKLAKTRCCKFLMITFVVASRTGTIHTNLKKASTYTHTHTHTHTPVAWCSRSCCAKTYRHSPQRILEKASVVLLIPTDSNDCPAPFCLIHTYYSEGSLFWYPRPCSSKQKPGASSELSYICVDVPPRGNTKKLLVLGQRALLFSFRPFFQPHNTRCLSWR